MLEEKAGYLDDMPINIRIINIRNYPLHYHYDHEFIYVLKGSVVLKCGSSIYKMQQGDIFIVNDSEVHGIYDCSDDNIVLMIQINAKFFLRQFPTLTWNVYRTMEKEKSNEEILVLRNLLLKIALNYIDKHPGYKMMNTNIMIDVLHYCDKYFKSFYFEGKIVMHKKYDHPEIGERLGRTIDYIYEHHNEKLTLRELAAKEHFSEGYMSKLITAGTGLGFRELLAFARVEESEILLLSGQEKISSIAAQVGFSTTAYYVKFFTKWFRCHPEEYRKMYADRIKGNSSEITFELSESEALSIILKSIKYLSFSTGENTEKTSKHHMMTIDAAQENNGVFRQRIVCIGNADGISGGFYNPDGLLKRITAEQIDEETEDHDECRTEGYALESALVMPYMVKKMLHNSQIRIPANKIFNGQGIPGSMFNVCRVTKLLEGELLSCGEFHIVTRSEDGKGLSIMLFNTSPDLELLCERKSTMEEVQKAIDRFSTELLSVKAVISNMTPGMYQIIERTYTHRNSLFYLRCQEDHRSQNMTDEELMTAMEIVAPFVEERKDYFDGEMELEYDLRGASSKLISIMRK